MEIQYRLADKRDIPQILSIIRQAQESIKKLGIGQWQDGYPNQKIFEADIQKDQCYVFVSKKQIAGVMVVSFEAEECYSAISGDGWRSDRPYGVLHRVAVAENGVFSLRVDTHTGNLPMWKFLNKHGFVLCGTVDYGGPDGKRIAFEKLL